MGFSEYHPGREFVVSLKHDADLVQAIAELARSKGIEAGTFVAIGALKRARLGFYDQKNHEYKEIEINTPHEMASCIGNVSLKDGAPFVHAHVVLADEAGNTKAGHLFLGKIYAAELHLHELKGPGLERKYDEVTDLSLWITEE